MGGRVRRPRPLPARSHGGRLIPPSATYRLQLHAGFGLHDALGLVPYFHALGVSHLYLSPIFQARAGSTHGYDVTDPTCINPEIGTLEEFRELATRLREHGMGILLDIVPNHMAADVQNPWWRDVLEHGPASPYARHFDIDWGASDGRLLLPLLGRHYGEAVEAGELRLEMGPDGIGIAYFDKRLPLDPATLPEVLDHAGADVPAALQELVGFLRGLPPRDEARGAVADRRYQEAQEIMRQLWERHEGDPEVRAAVSRALAAYDVEREPASAARRLDALIARQAYLPAYWRTASEEINYRRFFDITDLAGVRVEESAVFESTHALVLEWLRDGTIAGARVDHVDGLFDPTAYLQRLSAEATDAEGAPYIVVEKILGREERLPDGWPVAGTTGYETLNLINGLFVDEAGVRQLEEAFRALSGERRTFAELVQRAKRQVMKQLFGGEVHTLVGALIALAHHDLHGRDQPGPALGRALQEVTAALPVYRTYAREVDGAPELRPEDERVLQRAFAEARRRNPEMDPGVFDFLERVLLVSPRDETAAGRLAFLMRWQQLTGPVMAKGLEDTALYRWPTLLSACEVGSWPPHAAVSAAELHQRMAEIARRWPHTLNTLSTHDTKRSGDARARLNVLTELGREWSATLQRWTELNADKHVELEEGMAPSAIGEASIYQMLLAVWAEEGPDAQALAERIKAANLKSAREAKLRTSWHHPSEAYEQALADFTDRLLADQRFLQDFRATAQRLAVPGMINALAQTLLELTLPGVPDIYQGSESWAFALVDPDNRRPVDFELRRRHLEKVTSAAGPGRAPRERADAAAALLRDWHDGRIKLWLVASALRFRRERAALFAGAEYIPLEITGAHAECAFAFARRQGDDWCLVVVPRMSTRLNAAESFALGHAWGNSALRLPAGAPASWRDVLTGDDTPAAGDALPLRSLLRTLPVALLEGV